MDTDVKLIVSERANSLVALTSASALALTLVVKACCDIAKADLDTAGGAGSSALLLKDTN